MELRATGHRRANLGQYLVEAFHKQVAGVWHKHPGIEVMLRWTPGHGGIEGNERAYGEAKWAAKGQSSIWDSLPLGCRDKIPCSQSAARQANRSRINIKSKEWFEASPRCKRLWGINHSMRLPRFRKDTQGLA